MIKKNLVWKEDAIAIGAVALAMGLMFFSGGVLADSGTDELGSGICKLVGVLTGKWLFGFAMLAVLGAGAALLFGAEMTDGLKKIATIISVVGLILVAGGILSLAFTKFQGMTCA